MPSILPGYESDIFISYRHKDNKGEHWVTDFVRVLKAELETTFKEDLSIYFDENPHDGLLETYDVDKSLEGKLKSLVFIPILSQTYTDTKSYAWNNEFCAFNRLASQDEFGRDIKLRNGNIASRVLPVAIHNLDPEDRDLIENELQAKLRSIDFIFRSPGVNRALRREDKRAENANKLFYRDQLNKVANAIKEIITAMKYPNRAPDPGSMVISHEEENESIFSASKNKTAGEQALLDKSIAVLPFVSLAQDVSQEYFADGITENILIQLASLRHLRVISRTSIMKYKKTTKSAPEIANELGVKYILEGSAQSHGNKVRINVQLIDAQKDQHIWVKAFVESLDDIFTIQSNVAEAVAKELQSTLNPKENKKLKEKPTQNLEAYDLYLKGRHAFNQWGVEGYRTASEYYKRALEKDPDFKQAYSNLASSYSARMSWNGDLSPAEALVNINRYLEEAWKRGATDNDYLTKAFVAFFINKDFAEADKLLQKATELGPNNATVYYTHSYLMCMMGKYSEALALIGKGKAIEPNSVAYFNYYGICLYLQEQYQEAITSFQEAIKLYPQVLRFYDHLGRVYATMGKFEEAIEIMHAGLHFAKVRPPSMLAYLAIAHFNLKQENISAALLQELIQRSEKNEKGVNIYVAHIYEAMDNIEEATAWLTKAERTNDIDLIWRDVDPLLKKLRGIKRNQRAAPDFEGAESFIIRKQEKELPKILYYHNIEHIVDVLDASLKIAEIEKVPKEDIPLLRIAALYHDSGFITATKDHESHGCTMARETLPSFGLDNAQIEIICGMIMATKIPQTPQTLLEKVICDADLDYLGREDFYDVGSRLFEEMKENGFVESEREWNLIQKTFLESHRYHTPYAKKHREKKKQEHLQEIIAKFQR
ncbi:MAG: tetratricopeptide repeat protein [Cyclobacteriaceae bacterium]|nr:tetratricopeptide repeat protein [Cyclobacteriaceae bacterium]MDH4297343.1 tetratricopeptide repeat protein [Cyclobacteriaceae bacterium]MDH5248095.1 tetratricopeptide repeat protein [Cyclobacteriaceae bacterium]